MHPRHPSTRKQPLPPSQPCTMTVSAHPVVLVTGASRGLGLSVASLLLHGTRTLPAANVVTISRTLPDSLVQLQREQEQAKGETSLIVHQGDVCSDEDNRKVVEKALAKWGRLDAVVLNAGIIEFARLADVVSWSAAHVDWSLTPPQSMLA